eukprot:scaffold12185_cov114-Skeletonema_dohrnii-CCMP3373.AAC.6
MSQGVDREKSSSTSAPNKGIIKRTSSRISAAQLCSGCLIYSEACRTGNAAAAMRKPKPSEDSR